VAKNMQDTDNSSEVFKDEPMVMESVLIPSNHDEKLDRLAANAGLSKPEIIRRAIQDYVSKKKGES